MSWNRGALFQTAPAAAYMLRSAVDRPVAIAADSSKSGLPTAKPRRLRGAFAVIFLFRRSDPKERKTKKGEGGERRRGLPVGKPNPRQSRRRMRMATLAVDWRMARRGGDRIAPELPGRRRRGRRGSHVVQGAACRRATTPSGVPQHPLGGQRRVGGTRGRGRRARARQARLGGRARACQGSRVLRESENAVWLACGRDGCPWRLRAVVARSWPGHR
jgi:hypothetical protein